MNLVKSYATFIFIDGGRLRSSSGNSARTPLTSVSGLPCRVAWTPIKIACSPLKATRAAEKFCASYGGRPAGGEPRGARQGNGTEPQPHRKGLAAENIGGSNAVD